MQIVSLVHLIIPTIVHPVAMVMYLVVMAFAYLVVLSQIVKYAN